MVNNVRSLRSSREPWDAAQHAMPGTRFATPEQYRAGVPGHVRQSMVKDVVVEALTRGADADGVLLDFDLPEFFRTHVTAVLTVDDDAPALVYDRFAAITLMDCMTALMIHDGLLANRGNGDSADYRLTLPTEAQ